MIALEKLSLVPPATEEEIRYGMDRPGRSVLTEAIRSGAVTVQGRTDEEIAESLLLQLRAFRSGEGEILLVIDHLADLLRQARRSKDAGELWMACVLYATWVEHWVNRLIATAAAQRRMSQSAITQMLRDANWRAKTSWVFEALNLPPLEEQSLMILNRVVESRNAFVHYKWTPRRWDDSEPENDLVFSLQSADNEVERLLSYEVAALRDHAEITVDRIFGDIQPRA